MTLSARWLTALLCVHATSMPAVAQGQELPLVEATNRAELRMLLASWIRGDLGLATPPATVVGIATEIWIDADGVVDSVRHWSPLDDRMTFYIQVIQSEVWRHGVFPRGAPGWRRWVLQFDIAELAPTGDEIGICPTPQAFLALLDSAVLFRFGHSPSDGVQLEVDPAIPDSPECNDALITAVRSLRAAFLGRGGKICLKGECFGTTGERFPFQISRTELKWLTSSWDITTSDGTWDVDCLPKHKPHMVALLLEMCEAGRYQIIP